MVDFLFWGGHVIDSLYRFVDEVALLELIKDVRLLTVHNVTELLHCVHPLRLPIVELSIDLRESDQFVAMLVQLWVTS